MKRTLLACLLLAATALTACHSTQTSGTAELRNEMREQAKTEREQLKASGATAAQLREYDRAMEQMDQAMRQMEQQMHALERQLDKLPE